MTAPRVEPACGNCRFWLRDPARAVEGNDGGDIMVPSSRGRCRLRPPVVVTIGGNGEEFIAETVWPVTGAAEMCFEHRWPPDVDVLP